MSLSYTAPHAGDTRGWRLVQVYREHTKRVSHVLWHPAPAGSPSRPPCCAAAAFLVNANILLGDANILLGDANILLGDANILLGDANMLLGDANMCWVTLI
jgi:hypothetical protein